MIKKAFHILLLVSLAFPLLAQNEQAEYLEAKRLFRNGQYMSAKAAFGSLSESEMFGSYAGFYYGLSAYNSGDTTVALDMWRQLLLNFPNWDQKEELLFWLSYGNMQVGNYNQAFSFLSQYSEETGDSVLQERLILKYLEKENVERVKAIYGNNSDSRFIASILVKKLNDQPYEVRDLALIQKLMDKWDFEMLELESIELPNIRKQVYDIGVFLPFLFQSLSQTSVIIQNSLVMDLYQGMQFAVEDLKERSMPVNLLPYDTKRRGDVTKQILQKDEVKGLDIIIGPLYPGPNDAVNEFSLEHLINTINPISSNGDVVGGNPLSFLAKPSYESIAEKLASLATQELFQESDSNKYAMIFYKEGDQRDSVVAATYKKLIVENGFEVVRYQAFNEENSKTIRDSIAAQYDVYLTETEADSIKAIPKRFVRDRRIRADEFRRIEREARNDLIPVDKKFTLPVSYDDNRNAIVFYEKRFSLAPDSIGHIMVASTTETSNNQKSNPFANYIVGAIEARGDKIKLYGHGDWLDADMLSYAQLERLSVALAHSDYINVDSYNFDNVSNRMRRTLKKEPSVNHYRGYDLVWFLGNVLHTHGKYWQKDADEIGYQPGKIFEGYRYNQSNSNKVVPIVRFNDAVLEVVNKSHYED